MSLGEDKKKKDIICLLTGDTEPAPRWYDGYPELAQKLRNLEERTSSGKTIPLVRPSSRVWKSEEGGKTK